MDVTLDQAPAAPVASTHTAWRFEGRAGEYFKIWIVNLALTIVTLGIFSAWAKVRNKRYFYGNTFIGGHSFDYHGSPLRILLGRVIALVLLLSYSLSVNFGGPKAVIPWLVVFVIALPWLVKSSLRFNARNTSYRNVRFDFHGTYGGAFKAFVVWPVVAAISLFLTLPLAHRARDYYNINNHSFGGKNFEAVIDAGKLYGIYLLGLLFFFVAIALVGVAAVGSGIGNILANLKPGGHPPSPAVLMPFILLVSVVYIGTILFISAFIGTMTFNLALNSTQLADTIMLESKLSPITMTWIVVSNLFVVLVTLGLMYPWAHVRQTRYMVEHLAIVGPNNLDGFVSTAASQSGAIGEEVASFFDIDFGL